MLVRFDEAGSDTRLPGIRQAAVTAAFLGTAPRPLATLDGPAWARNLVAREHAAADITFQAIAAGRMRCPGPWTGIPATETYAFIPASWNLHGFGTVPVVKAFEDDGREFFLAFAALNAKPTHLIIPSLGCVLHEFDRARAAPLYEAIVSHVDAHGAPLRARDFAGTVCLVDMVTNFGHQMINHLSGLQRLVENGLEAFVEEIWIAGVEFFGRAETLFPEIAPKIRRVKSSEIVARLDTTRLRPVRLGSSHLQASLQSRIIRHLEPARSPSARLVAFTVRGHGRVCRNLPEVVEQVVVGLLPTFPDIRIVLDGWVQADSQIVCGSDVVSAFSGPFHASIKADCDLCLRIMSRLPAGIVERVLIGRSMSDSLAWIRDIRGYVAHIGTLQHKVAFFSGARGIVHGPAAELQRLDAGPYCAESGQPPDLLKAACVRDIPTGTTRGPGHFDYEITDISGIIETLQEILGGDDATSAIATA